MVLSQPAILDPMLHNDPATAVKIALPGAVGVVISNELGIVGATPVEEMR